MSVWKSKIALEKSTQGIPVQESPVQLCQHIFAALKPALILRMPSTPQSVISRPITQGQDSQHNDSIKMAEGHGAQSTSARLGETAQATAQRDPVYEENGASIGFISIMSMICHLAALFLIPWIRSYTSAPIRGFVGWPQIF